MGDSTKLEGQILPLPVRAAAIAAGIVAIVALFGYGLPGLLIASMPIVGAAIEPYVGRIGKWLLIAGAATRMSVDEIVAGRASKFDVFRKLPRERLNAFNRKHLEAQNFNRFQHLLESGSGPGGRWFKSARSIIFQRLSEPVNFSAINSVHEIGAAKSTGSNTAVFGIEADNTVPRRFAADFPRESMRPRRPKTIGDSQKARTGSTATPETSIYYFPMKFSISCLPIRVHLID